MANYYTELAPNQVRRADREVTDETWLKALLHRGAVGYLATVQGGTAVFRIQIEQWSGKKKEVAADFPGAYLYEDIADK